MSQAVQTPNIVSGFNKNNIIPEVQVLPPVAVQTVATIPDVGDDSFNIFGLALSRKCVYIIIFIVLCIAIYLAYKWFYGEKKGKKKPKDDDEEENEDVDDEEIPQYPGKKEDGDAQ